MIVVFMVDSSASMNQKFSNGMSALECTKSGIEHLVKHLPHVKPADKHNDKFMLVTYEEGPGGIKSSLKDPLPHLIKELKVLKANDISNPAAALTTILDVLNAYRVYHGTDTPAGMSTQANTAAGTEYNEPFRWDQRLYTIFLEPNTDVVDQQLSVPSNIMGGTSYRVRSLRHMLQAMDCMLGISKIPPTQYSPQAVLHIYGVVVNFEDLIVDPRRPSTANHHQLVYVNPTWLVPQTRHAGFFPIPEPFWPEIDAQKIPRRHAQPTLYYHPREERSVEIPEGFPYDKYVVAPCPMTQELLTRPLGSCWPVYIKNSYRTEGFGFPFGFLKANTNKNAVTLTVVAYNYPALFTLLVNLNSIPGRTPTAQWLRDFAEYLSHTPAYYYAPLRTALRRIGLSNIIPPDQGTMTAAIQRTVIANKAQELQLTSPTSQLPSTFSSAAAASETSTKAKANLKADALRSGTVFSRLDALADSDELHSLPIADMGIYQDRMQKMQQETLRDPYRDEESAKSLQKTMFGNPYKQDKKVSIDEEDEASAADSSVSSNNSSSGSSWSSILGRKRKPRWRSVSPSHFPIEKIPSLAHGERSVSGKAQVVTLGAIGGGATPPVLRLMIQDSSGKPQFTDEEAEGHGRHMVMHDGEDQDDDDEDFRRAMYNSDEMELDGDEEAARLRADTPMPGGIGLDDDDEDMEDLQHAQELIPPPIMPVSLDDIEAAGFIHQHHKDGSTAATVGDMEYERHRQVISDDLEHLHGSKKPVFESLVYDPTALMELQSIPAMIPERPSSEGVPSSAMNGSKTFSQPFPSSDVQDSLQSTSHDLMPIPILQAPVSQALSMGVPGSVLSKETAESTTATADRSIVMPLPSSAVSTTVNNDSSQAHMDEAAEEQPLVEGALDARGSGDTSATTSTSPSSSTRLGSPHKGFIYVDVDPSTTGAPQTLRGQVQEAPSMEETLLEFRDSVTTQLLLPSRAYNTEAILNMVCKLQVAPNWTKEQKRIALMGCLNVAKSLRRDAAVIAALEMP
ncbi:Integrator complex subunit 6 [Mortierella alpina]|uniref:Integrator complex subunit 6 n=1 Tax=Mortierella alpina TaxID=64518 RepID=A0A9P6J858_MORAP|nr:Integrator complex subunit 6 [Mortierella alpina]